MKKIGTLAGRLGGGGRVGPSVARRVDRENAPSHCINLLYKSPIDLGGTVQFGSLGGYAAAVSSGIPAGEQAPVIDDVLYSAAASAFDLLAWMVRLTPRDITLTSLFTLATLQRTGPRRITELAGSEGVTQPTITALITSLERAGLVERRGDPADRRVVLVAITDAGSAYLRERRDASAQVIARAMTELSPDEAAALTAAVPAVEHLRSVLEFMRPE